MKLGTRIKDLRKKKGFTQVELSQQTGLSLRTIQRIENNENKPSVYSLRKIGEALNYTFNLNEFNIMKNIFEKENRNYLVLIVALISIAGYFYYTNQLDNYVDVVDMKIASDNIEDFIQFEWESMKEVVSLDTDKEVVVRLVYQNKDSVSSGVNNFDLKFTLTESGFEKDVSAIEHSLQKLTAVELD